MLDDAFFALDLAATCLLAAGAACRARSNGAHVSGAAVLACVVGLTTPLARDALLHCASAPLDRPEYVLASVLGALLGCLGAHTSVSWKIFFWLDAAGLALCAGVATVRGSLLGLGPSGSLLLGVLAALVGNSVRDVALGDMARFVEEDMYATAALFGSMLSLVVLLYAHLPAWICALLGALLTLVLRGRRAGSSV